ncbi:serine/threonine protein kinase, CMGC, CDC2/CDK sub [Phlyctochytrium bullatum]|nr:serine/threonine protein kinase, CMGC, CDC2/CDK sub [Phlyctochytrium bullatum]
MCILLLGLYIRRLRKRSMAHDARTDAKASRPRSLLSLFTRKDAPPPSPAGQGPTVIDVGADSFRKSYVVVDFENMLFGDGAGRGAAARRWGRGRGWVAAPVLCHRGMVKVLMMAVVTVVMAWVHCSVRRRRFEERFEVKDAQRRMEPWSFDGMKQELTDQVSHGHTVLIHVPEKVSDYTTIFHHPYQVIHETRRCHHACAFVSHDFKYAEPFTQHGFDHLWLTPAEAERLTACAHGQLGQRQLHHTHVARGADGTEAPAKGGAVSVVVAARPARVVYHHPSNASYFDPNVVIPFSTGMVCGNRLRRVLEAPTNATTGIDPPAPRRALAEWDKEGETVLPCSDMTGWAHPRKSQLTVGFGRTADVPILFIDRVYADFWDFGSIVKETQMSGRTFYKRIRGVVAFTPACTRLHPGAINFLARLIRVMNVHVYGHCLTTHRLDKGQKLTEQFRVRTAARYLFVLVWEENGDVEGYLSEEYYKALAYSAVPVIWGPEDLEKYFPADEAHIPVRRYIDHVEDLATTLQGIAKNASRWEDMMSWRNAKSGSELREGFPYLWERAATRMHCRICEGVAKRVPRLEDGARRATPLVDDRSMLNDLILKHANIDNRMVNSDNSNGEVKKALPAKPASAISAAVDLGSREIPLCESQSEPAESRERKPGVERDIHLLVLDAVAEAETETADKVLGQWIGGPNGVAEEPGCLRTGKAELCQATLQPESAGKLAGDQKEDLSGAGDEGDEVGIVEAVEDGVEELEREDFDWCGHFGGIEPGEVDEQSVQNPPVANIDDATGAEPGEVEEGAHTDPEQTAGVGLKRPLEGDDQMEDGSPRQKPRVDGGEAQNGNAAAGSVDGMSDDDMQLDDYQSPSAEDGVAVSPPRAPLHPTMYEDEFGNHASNVGSADSNFQNNDLQNEDIYEPAAPNLDDEGSAHDYIASGPLSEAATSPSLTDGRSPALRKKGEKAELRQFSGCSPLEDYQAEKKIGEGTFGEVTTMTHKRTQKRFALKKILMHNEKEGIPITALREIKILKCLNHKNIIQLAEMAVKKELLLGVVKYGPAIDMWGVGCVFGEILRRRPILQGSDDLDQLQRIFKLFLEDKRFDGVVDLIDHLLICDPAKRLNAIEAKNHRYFFTNPVAAVPGTSEYVPIFPLYTHVL